MTKIFYLLVALMGAVSLVAGQTSEKEIMKSEKSPEDMIIFLGSVFVAWFILFVVPAAWKRLKVRLRNNFRG